ncbi:hypothetical protein M2192_004262 [Bradyrhizobium elkanii USDA 61]|nr:hypothetical protein [Bradyrhizobium elkanii]MCS3473308.1 hypothetical protein [Bradyrhizobium elkanii]MCS3580015.1 hypothetical protein [Bradyrhizobium elkanii]MCS3722888.1 hypothetical protein [Bradyrhizobium elkanii]MCS4007302.1 hypothetical protein [Bradyrhizobium elkanii USDA 61]
MSEETVTTITRRHQVSFGEHRNLVRGNGIGVRAMPMERCKYLCEFPGLTRGVPGTLCY